MSLYFKERVQEQDVAAFENDNIIFSLRMIAATGHSASNTLHRSFRTTYANLSLKWDFLLSKDGFQINGSHLLDNHLPQTIFAGHKIWEGTCYFTYKLYSVSEELEKIYSSSRMSVPSLPVMDIFRSSDGSMKEFSDAYEKQQITFIIISIELELPIKFFLRPFEMPCNNLAYKLCDEYPEDTETDFRFEFWNESDFIFKCPDGDVPAMKMVLNVSSSFMKKYLNESSNDEFVVEHAVDVVKPINTFMHSRCFEMPKSYTLDYANRLLDAIEFFELTDVRLVIYYSLCQKFVEEPPDFESLLQLLSFASEHSFYSLIHMIAVEIATKYYYKWHQTSSDDEMNIISRLLFDSFISEKVAFWICDEIEEIFKWSLVINAILP